MILPHNSCITAAFMWSGLKEDDTLLELWGRGCYELCYEITQYSELSELLMEELFKHIEYDYPGVYDYEVSEPFGKWFREHIETHPEHDAPSKQVAAEKLKELVLGFFHLGDAAQLSDQELTRVAREWSSK